jgi:uncharacterized lipoprotein YddW (UPF0748 family)
VAVCAGLAALALACGEEPAPEPQPAPPAPAAAAPPPRGLWVLCQGSQRVLDQPEKLPALIEDARALGVSDLFVQVYRGGRAWFDSSHADAGPWRRNRDAAGQDTLALLIRSAQAAGLRVHAWVNVLNLADNRRAPLVESVGSHAVLVDQRGRSLLDYPKLDVPEPDRRYYRLGTPGVWLDPAAPGVSEYLVETFRELAERYPELDGIHLDYIRYPGVLPFAPGSRFGVGLDMGHGARTRERFRAETGLEAPRPPDRLDNADRWDGWRRDQVTELVRAIAGAARAERPGLSVSAAVWSHAERAYLSIGQDWRRWLEEGLLDLAVPMAYTQDARLLRYQAEDFARAPQAARTWVGLGSWLFARRPAGAVEQLAIVRAAGAAGESLFSWDSIADAPSLRAALARAAAGEPAAGEPPPAAPGDEPEPPPGG